MHDPSDAGNHQTLSDRPPSAHRREFIKTALLTGGAAVLTCVPPAVYFVSPSLKAGGGKWVDFGLAEDLQPDNFSMLTYEFMVKDGWLVLPQRGFVWAMSNGNEDIKVFSSTCTHLACNVIWNEAQRVFECPCHSGRFDERGLPIAGPPTRPLSILEHKVQEGNLMVFMSL